MNGRIATLGLAVVWGAVSLAAAAERPEPQPLSGKINWVFDYEEGKRLSRDSGKPLFVIIRCER